MHGVRISNGQPQDVTDRLLVEGALQILINGGRFTITMRTPGDDRRLGLGLLLTEGVLHADADLPPSTSHTASDIDDSAVLHFEIPGFDGTAHQRSLMSTAACGLCGKRNLCDLSLDQEKLATPLPLHADHIPLLFDTMQSRQRLFEDTGGSHAAAALTVGGELLAFAEDVGRHNAVDKVVGQLLEEDQLSDADVLLVSGRVSYEIIYKAYRARLPYVVAVSAPSSLAVSAAEARNMTLIAFCRGDRATVYSNAHHISGLSVDA